MRRGCWRSWCRQCKESDALSLRAQRSNLHHGICAQLGGDCFVRLCLLAMTEASAVEAHRLIIGASHRVRLPDEEKEFAARRYTWTFPLDLLARQTVDELPTTDDRQRDAAV